MATVDNRLPTEGTQIDIEARLAAIETALASLMADTTGQSIASAISGLGATLGSDKANIDGSNIASPATFRSNIGAAKKTWTLINGNIQTDTEQTLTGYNEYLIILVYSGIKIAGMVLPINDVNSTISIRSVISGAQVIEGYYNNSTHKWTLTTNCYVKLYGR